MLVAARRSSAQFGNIGDIIHTRFIIGVIVIRCVTAR